MGRDATIPVVCIQRSASCCDWLLPEMIYGWDVRGPLDILKEAWTADSNEDANSVISFVLTVRNCLQRMMVLARGNELLAENHTKVWYEKNARHRSF